ncbi:MAG: FMN-binding protein [Gemmatimonadota bacterium]|jgi:hypothetical protein|nr:hypothetical protein [Gemmatimonadota bacterium]MDP6529829.1 FMN-binding protein [Gemmatimonadota bacterium]MDP6802772.1 FMN-binding protein [Gemmatimonadota bacterium]MDP7032104.1 FMN-binding protein [Gemmatimonadota bacterium]
MGQSPHPRIPTLREARSADGRLLGWAWFDTRRVRNQPQTILVTASPDGALLDLRLVAFHEPWEYRPPAAWLRRLSAHRFEEELPPPDRIDTLTGATYTARAAVATVRRAREVASSLARPTGADLP